MEPQTQIVNKQKIIQTVDKYVELIRENKLYQFTQKIQLLAHRKQQSKRYEDAELIILCGVEKLFTLLQQQKNEPFSLLDHLLKIYEAHPELWTLEKGKKIYSLLNIKNNEQKYNYYLKFLKTLKNKPFPKDLLIDLINHYVDQDQFTKAESHVLELDLPTVKKFLGKWTSKVSEDEACAIRCRLALLRGVFSKESECDELLEGVDQDNAFAKFSKFLIFASKLKSRQAYNLIGSRYKQFLESDEIYNKIYQVYGMYFFKINPPKGNSLLDLLG